MTQEELDEINKGNTWKVVAPVETDRKEGDALCDAPVEKQQPVSTAVQSTKASSNAAPVESHPQLAAAEEWRVKRADRDGFGGINKLRGWALWDGEKELCFDSDEGAQEYFQNIADAHNSALARHSAAKASGGEMKSSPASSTVTVPQTARSENSILSALEEQYQISLNDARQWEEHYKTDPLGRRNIAYHQGQVDALTSCLGYLRDLAR